MYTGATQQVINCVVLIDHDLHFWIVGDPVVRAARELHQLDLHSCATLVALGTAFLVPSASGKACSMGCDVCSMLSLNCVMMHMVKKGVTTPYVARGSVNS